MKTILDRMKTLVNNNKGEGGTLSYVQHVEIIHPDIALLNISRTMFPSIFLIPQSSREEWEASQRKMIQYEVTAYLVMEYNQRELSIMGDSSRADGRGILDFYNDFATVFRGHRLAVDDTNYLDKPLEFGNVDYVREDLSEDAFAIIAAITIQCTKLILQTSLPGNI